MKRKSFPEDSNSERRQSSRSDEGQKRHAPRKDAFPRNSSSDERRPPRPFAPRKDAFPRGPVGDERRPPRPYAPRQDAALKRPAPRQDGFARGPDRDERRLPRVQAPRQDDGQKRHGQRKDNAQNRSERPSRGIPRRDESSADALQKREIKVYGLHACLALFKQRPNDIIRVYCEESRVGVLSPLLKWCAANKKAYHIIPDEELVKVTQSVHHEGVCVLAIQPNAMTFDQLLLELPKMGKNICLLYLDDIQNPHNVGSILRICAHFGVAYILGDAEKFPELTPSGYRIAKGGAEAVQLIPLPNSKKAFQQLKQAGFSLVGSSSHSKTSLYQYTFPQRTLLAFGAEGTGLSPLLMKEVTAVLQIPGSGEVESLNVAIASALFLGEYWRQTQA